MNIGDKVSVSCAVVRQVKDEAQVVFSNGRFMYVPLADITTPAPAPILAEKSNKFQIGEHVIHKFAPHWGVGVIVEVDNTNCGVLELTNYYEGKVDDVSTNVPYAPYLVRYPHVTGRDYPFWWTAEENLISVDTDLKD